MGYIDKILQPGETVLAVGRMHWIVYVIGTVITLVGLAVLIFLPVNNLAILITGGLVIAVGIIHLAASWFETWTTEIVVTNKRVVRKKGFIQRDTAEMNMDKVESVIVNQTILGRLLGYGSIVIRGTGAGIEGLHHIDNPLALRSSIVVR